MATAHNLAIGSRAFRKTLLAHHEAAANNDPAPTIDTIDLKDTLPGPFVVVLSGVKVSGLELGQRNPTIVTLWHVAKALDVDFNEIFGSSRGKPRGQKPTEQRAASKRLLPASPRKR